ncbi:MULTISPECIES: type 1 glutamine amidotransferase family protein [Alphaproteobacteria]|uniref:Glutamine amidotransferase n=2 Tax=Alphaproteobacteria TaxID=28211 RepID=A0A512HFR6_9HYPH|nr:MULTISPECIES: type 1 glutamine amidotransferase family protein [Alphaproteobacteria]GEO84289.1 glutamine amidotransferase [Ciceribacter naphthalenivorans]GLR24825.1 glutamine amidotransferase [Ciceribacter naphthalenivorans]GLT07681.1 glutamine amidotransferase [Sphingomonas psychrolutea]
MPRIAVALQADFADWEPALLMAAARYYLGCEVLSASPDGAPVTSMGGLKVTPDLSFADIDADRFDALVIPGGYAWEKGQAYDFSTLATAFHAQGKVVAGICAAASGLAATGLLDDVAHTGNSLASHSNYPGYHGASRYLDQPQAVSDGGVVTAPGNSPVTFTMEILKALGLWAPQAEAQISAFAREHR